MITRESQIVGVTTIGLLNSDCHDIITYPIFANGENFKTTITFTQTIVNYHISQQTLHKIANEITNFTLPENLEISPEKYIDSYITYLKELHEDNLNKLRLAKLEEQLRKKRRAVRKRRNNN